ncbi:MAG: hypothetical protein LBK23_09315 [Oscillospiraceae bacterium]|nr:hypothetical protein [Oscillospiraceae bacterium]
MPEANRVKKRRGDRTDGRWLRTLDSYHVMPSYIMVKRNDASNYFSDSIEVTDIDRYLRKKRADGMAGLGILHVVAAAYVRMAAKYPGVNRFVSGQRVFARHGVELVMTVKSDLKIEAPETSIKVRLELTDTIGEVFEKVNAQIERVKNKDKTSTDAVAGSLVKFPRLFLKFAMFMLNLLDYFGKMPKAVLEASPFHGSVIITDLGSIGLPPIYHHLYNFGNLPLFISLGTKRREVEAQKDGAVAERKYLDYTLVADERIADGFYFSQVYRYFKAILKTPEVLDSPPDEVIRDID